VDNCELLPVFYRSFLHGGALGLCSDLALATHRGLVRAEQRAHPKASSVFTERIDHHSHGDGRGLTTPHIAGLMEVRDRRMSARRDVYDTVISSQDPTQPDRDHPLAKG